jgi:hypothetical protein
MIGTASFADDAVPVLNAETFITFLEVNDVYR